MNGCTRRWLGVILVSHGAAFAPVHAQGQAVTNLSGHFTPPGYQYAPALSNIRTATPGINVAFSQQVYPTVRTITSTQIDDFFINNTIQRRAVSAGRTVFTRGNIAILGVTAIAAALTWFYNQAQEAANPPRNALDYWGKNAEGYIMKITVSRSQGARIVGNETQYEYRVGEGVSKDTPASDMTVAVTNLGYMKERSIEALAVEKSVALANVTAATWPGMPSFTWVSIPQSDPSRFYELRAKVTYGSLASYVRAFPNAKATMPAKWESYIGNKVAQPGFNENITQIEGLEYDVGNLQKSQWTDKPADSVDVDGDGWKDVNEVKLGHYPINPYTDINPYVPPPVPYSDYDSDNDGYSDKNEDDSNTDPTISEDTPPGVPDRPREPWEEDPRIQDDGDADNDGQLNIEDPDDDNDGIADEDDQQPFVPGTPTDPTTTPDPTATQEPTDPGTVTDPTPGDGITPSEGDTDGDGVEDSEDEYITPLVDPTPGDGTWPSPGDADGDGVPDTDPTATPDPTSTPDPTEPEPRVDPTPGDDIAPTPGDSDGDGIPDAEDPYVTPTTDPTPGDNIWPSPGDPNGDGVPDVEPSTPTEPTAPPVDPSTTPDPSQPPEEPGEEPSPLDPGAGPGLGPLDLPIPTLTFPTQPFITWRDNTTTKITQWRESMSNKFPFGLGTWIPMFEGPTRIPPCKPIKMTMLGHEQDVGICDTPIDEFFAGPGRAAVLFLAAVAFWYASARIMAAS